MQKASHGTRPRCVVDLERVDVVVLGVGTDIAFSWGGKCAIDFDFAVGVGEEREGGGG